MIELDDSLGVEKALVFSNIPLWESQFVVTAEIINELHKNRVEVHWLNCVGSLSSCPANPLHSLDLCNVCIKRTDFFAESFVPKEVKIHQIDSGEEYKVPEFISQLEFEQFSYKNMPAGKLARSQLVDEANDLTLSLNLINTKGKTLIQDAISLFEQARSLILEHSIEIVFVWNGRRSSDGPVLYAARNLAKRAICYSSGGSFNRYYLQENSLHSVNEWSQSMQRFKDSTKLTSEELVSEAQKFYHRQKYGGHTNYDHSYFGQAFFNGPEVELSSTKRKLTIFTTSSWETINFAERDHLPDDFKDSYKVIDNILADDSICDEYQVIVRWHPNLVNAGPSEAAKIRGLIQKYPEVLHYPPESSVNSYSLLERTSVVVTTGSTMGIEATYFGKVSILLGFSIYQNLGVCYIPTCYSDFRDLVLSDPLPKEKQGCHLYGAFMLNYGSQFNNFELRKGKYVLKTSPKVTFLKQSRLPRVLRNQFTQDFMALIFKLRLKN